MIALDASALLAFLFREAGHERVAEVVDRSCLALASSRGIPALTADRAWADLNIDVAIRVIP